MNLPPAVVCVDLGKTRCRVVLVAGTEQVDEQIAPGLPGLAQPGAPERTAEVIAGLVSRLAGSDGAPVGVGAAGALSAPDAAARLAELLAATLDAPAAVTSDIVTAHLGALSGRAGVCLVAGTGAVALGVSADGAMSRRDGLGLMLGDLGSGAWIGRAGVRAAELAQSGVGPATVLADRIPAARDAATLAGAPDAATRIARHAPTVLDAAAQGDEVASGILTEAATLLAQTAAAASADVGQSDVVALGGLTGSEVFLDTLRAALTSHALTLRDPDGTALDGARILATRRDLLLEGYIHRAHA